MNAGQSALLRAALLGALGLCAALPAPAQNAGTAVDTIAVEPVRPQDAPDEPTGFPDEGPSALFGNAWLASGYDSNSNSSTQADRFFFFDLTQEEKASESEFGEVGGNVGYIGLFGKRIAWRSIAAATARSNFSAHFSDTRYANAQTQLRWSGERTRLSAGVIYANGRIDNRKTDRAAAGSVQVERLLGKLLIAAGADFAGYRFYEAPVRDVDSKLLRLSMGDPPNDFFERWAPLFSVYAGRETPKLQGSPFGRDFYGAGGSITGQIGTNLRAGWDIDANRSEYDGRFTLAEDRKDTRFSTGLSVRWQRTPDSPWAALCGARVISNQSNEPLYDTTRSVITLEISRAWRPAKPAL